MNSNDEQALRDLVAKLEAAWNAGDSAAWASHFAGDADFIHILGLHYSDRATIEGGHRVIFDTIYRGSRNKITIEKIRPLGPDAAIVFTHATLTFYEGDVERHLEARPTLVAQRVERNWVIVAFQNTLVAQDMSAADQDAVIQRHPFRAADKSTAAS